MQVSQFAFLAFINHKHCLLSSAHVYNRVKTKESLQRCIGRFPEGKI